MDPSQTDLEEIKALRKKGLYLEAQRRLQGRTAPEEWEDGERPMAAALVLERVGEPRRARRLVRRVWRRDLTTRSPAREEMIWLVFSFRGALTAWEWWQRYPIPAGMPLEETTDHLGLGAYLLGTLRDFVRAQELLTEGLRQNADNPWLSVVGGLLESMQDRPEPAVGLLRRALELNPAAVGGIHGLADALVASGREGEVEAASLAVSLATLQFELGDFAGAERSLDRYAELTPNAEEESQNWLAARRCDLACHLGQHAAAAAHAGRVKGSVFYERLCTRLSGSHEGLQRRELGVGFVRQHQLTCAPATFTTLARYWNRDVMCSSKTANSTAPATPSRRFGHISRRRWPTREKLSLHLEARSEGRARRLANPPALPRRCPRPSLLRIEDPPQSRPRLGGRVRPRGLRRSSTVLDQSAGRRFLCRNPVDAGPPRSRQGTGRAHARFGIHRASPGATSQRDGSARPTGRKHPPTVWPVHAALLPSSIAPPLWSLAP